MVTSAFKNIIDSFIEKVKNIYAFNKEQYDAELETLKQQLRESLDALQLEHPLLTAYNRTIFEENPKMMFDAIENNAAGVNTLKYIVNGGHCHRISIDAINDTICQPDLIDISEYGNVVISPMVEFDDDEDVREMKSKLHVMSTIHLYELLMNMLLSVEIGKLHISFVNLGMSEDVQPIVSKLHPSIYDMITDDNEMKRLSVYLSNILKQKVTTGTLTNDRTEIVVLLDYRDFREKMTEEFSVLFNKGKSANIHFILFNPGLKEDDKGLLNTNNYFASTANSSVSKLYNNITAGDLYHCHCLHDLPKLWEACYNYINEFVSRSKCKQTDFSKVPYEETTSDIAAPIGALNSGDIVDFKFDVNKGHYHAFVIGETGSGKSRFLHDVIINMIGKYSPEDVELYLMDFKGVEFNDYKDIKHSRVVLVDRADERITYEVIRELKEKMEERQRVLASSGASDVDEYNKMSSDKHLSQIILVVDECQTLFADRTRNSRLQSEMIGIIALVAQQGRAYGVHLLLATQSLSNAPLLGKDILNQIGEHYILPCLPADARRLVPDHEQRETEEVVSKMEKGKGQCYYQGADGKFLFTFNYIAKGEQQDCLIETVKNKTKDYSSNGQIYFSGSLKYEMTEDTINVLSSKGRRRIVASPGQDIAITQKPTSIALHEEQGENIMILGINDKHYATRTAINLLVSSIATSTAKGLDYEFIVIDCMKCEDDEEYMDVLDELESRRMCKLIKPRERKKTLYDLCKNIASGNTKPTILTILGEETFRELKFDDSLDIAEDEKQTSNTPVDSFEDALAMMSMLSNPVVEQAPSNSDMSNIKTVSAAIKYILDKGPENGVHTIMQLDRADNFYIDNDGYINSKTIYSRFCHLIILRSNEKDIHSLKLPDEIRPDTLEDNAERLRAYYYNEGSNTYGIFTPYMMPSVERVNNILK